MPTSVQVTTQQSKVGAEKDSSPPHSPTAPQPHCPPAPQPPHCPAAPQGRVRLRSVWYMIYSSRICCPGRCNTRKSDGTCLSRLFNCAHSTDASVVICTAPDLSNNVIQPGYKTDRYRMRAQRTVHIAQEHLWEPCRPMQSLPHCSGHHRQHDSDVDGFSDCRAQRREPSGQNKAGTPAPDP